MKGLPAMTLANIGTTTLSNNLCLTLVELKGVDATLDRMRENARSCQWKRYQQDWLILDGVSSTSLTASGT